jgi:hypothetical protein
MLGQRKYRDGQITAMLSQVFVTNVSVTLQSPGVDEVSVFEDQDFEEFNVDPTILKEARKGTHEPIAELAKILCEDLDYGRDQMFQKNIDG